MSYSSNDAMLMAGGRDWSTCSGFPQRRGVQCARNSEPRASDDWFARRTSRPREMTVRRRSVTLQEWARGSGPKKWQHHAHGFFFFYLCHQHQGRRAAGKTYKQKGGYFGYRFARPPSGEWRPSL